MFRNAVPTIYTEEDVTNIEGPARDDLVIEQPNTEEVKMTENGHHVDNVESYGTTNHFYYLSFSKEVVLWQLRKLVTTGYTQKSHQEIDTAAKSVREEVENGVRSSSEKKASYIKGGKYGTNP
ncbi:unnamed protein product [Parnassius apollo]|uniref:(apollo) hypothetical protein n=1 Tax=Parnassius apollo TaxID=110799 RepID=A0A8S3Y3P9_PARAO|nr:unnamed protein product [Parnassius apollo]